MALRTALLCLLTITAGCTAPIGGSGNTTPNTATPITTTSPTTQSPTETTDSDTPMSTCEPYKPTAGLVLKVSDGVTAQLTVTEVESNSTVVDRAVSGYERVVYDGSNGVFEPRTTYRVVIRANGSVRYNGTISPTEEYRLTVEQNGSVTVEAVIVEDTPTPCSD